MNTIRAQALRYNTVRAIWPINSCQNLHPSIYCETPGVSQTHSPILGQKGCCLHYLVKHAVFQEGRSQIE